MKTVKKNSSYILIEVSLYQRARFPNRTMAIFRPHTDRFLAFFRFSKSGLLVYLLFFYKFQSEENSMYLNAKENLCFNFASFHHRIHWNQPSQTSQFSMIITLYDTVWLIVILWFILENYRIFFFKFMYTSNASSFQRTNYDSSSHRLGRIY